jgi:hypothetical protein
VLHPIAELLGDVARVLGERLRSVRRLPAAEPVLECLRQVPVVQGREGLDADGEQLVDEAAVEVDPFRIRLARAFREDPRPRDREPVRRGADRFEQRDVFPVPVVVVVGDVAVVVVLDVPGRVRVRVPDRQALAVLVPSALDLTRRRRDAQWKPSGKRRAGVRVSRPLALIDHLLLTSNETSPHPELVEQQPPLWVHLVVPCPRGDEVDGARRVPARASTAG